MIALDARRFTGASPFYDPTFHAAPCKIHRQTQPDGPATDDQHLGLTGFAHARFTFATARLRSDSHAFARRGSRATARRVLSRTIFSRMNPRHFTGPLPSASLWRRRAE